MDCEKCDFRCDTVLRAEIAGRLLGLAASHVQMLTTSPDAWLRSQPAAEVWSPLEYACHVRDVLLVQRGRVEEIQREHEPDLVPMGRDERAVRDRYNEQAPAVVAAQISDAAAMLAACLADLDDAAWLRQGTYNWPVRCLRSVEWIGQQTVHELDHHLRDVRAGIDAASGRALFPGR